MSDKRNRRPPAWKTARLGEVLPLKYGKARNEQFGFTREETQTYGSNGAFGTYDRALTLEPSLIVGRKGAAGAVHYSPDPCWPIDTAFYTEGNDATHLPFFRYLLESLNLGRLDQSTAIPSLSRDVYDSTEVCFPESIDEQRRIVAEIEKQFSRLDEGVAALKRAQTNLKRYRAAVLKAACEGRLVENEVKRKREEGRSLETGEQLLQRILAERRHKWQGRGKYKEPAAPDTSKLPILPEGWTWATAEQLTDENRSITYGVIKLGEHVSDGVPVLRSSDVRHLRLDLEAVKRVEPDIAGEYRRTFLKGGELLITVRGTLGGIVVAPADCAGYNISREVAMLAMIEPKTARAMAIFIGSNPIQHWLMQRTKGIAYTGINIETLKQVPIPLPPLAEQKRIVAEVERRLSVIDELESAVSANLPRAMRLRQAVLQKAFKGS